MNQGGVKRNESVVPTYGVKFLFGVIFFTNLLINVDHGILPACTFELRRDLDLNTVNIGVLGSLVYLGLVIGKISFFNSLGSLVAMPVFQYLNTKLVLIICIFCNAFCLFLFT